MTRRRGLFGITLLAIGLSAAVALAGSAPATRLPERPVAVRAHVLPDFQIGHPEEAKFGRLHFVGGFEIEADTRMASGLSGIEVRDSGAALTAITDRGVMLAGDIVRDASGRPVGFANARLRSIDGVDPTDLSGAKEPDAEGFGAAGTGPGDRAYVSLETIPRILTGTFDKSGFVGPMSRLAIPPELSRLRKTKGLEALAVAPPGGPLAGRLIVFAERPPRDQETRDRPGWVLAADGRRVAGFHLADDGFDVTDAAFGPDGMLYVLERLFTPAVGPATRIRRIDPVKIVEGAVVDGEEILKADLSHQIDNMEGLSLWQDESGRTMLSLVSDDNGSFMQRALYLEFALEP